MTDTKSPSSSPFHLCDTEVEFVLRKCPVWQRFLSLAWSGHRNHDSDVENCVCRRLSEGQPVFGVFQGDRPCNVALDVLWPHINRKRRRVGIYKRG